jgi:hypothetical protein
MIKRDMQGCQVELKRAEAGSKASEIAQKHASKQKH